MAEQRTTTDLLATELATVWSLTEAGHLVAAPEYPVSSPLIAVATSYDGVIWRFAPGLDVADTSAFDELLMSEKPSSTIGWRPRSASVIAALLTDRHGAVTEHRGPSYLARCAPSEGPGVLTSTMATPDDLIGLMDEDDRTRLEPPWAVVIDDGVVGAVCETSRARTGSVEAGLWTYEAHRRRGLATAATAAWATLVTDRTAFYSTEADNVGSQAVATRLGFEPLGQIWHLEPAT